MPVYDNHFDAMNIFRFIGYLLANSLGRACPALWDPNNPNVWDYGPYDKKLCQPLPGTGYELPNQVT